LSFRHRDAESEQAGFERGLKIAERLDLDLKRWVGLMSTGMRQKLALAVTFAADVPMLILDEPTANLDPTVQSEVLAMVNEAGKTVIFSSHVLTEIESICDRVAVMRKGQLVHVQSMAEFNRRHRIQGTLDERFAGKLPEVPEALKERVKIAVNGRLLQVDIAGELVDGLDWLATLPLSEVSVGPMGLQSVYDRFHFAEGNEKVADGQGNGKVEASR